MEVGVHLPQCAFGGQVADTATLNAFVGAARDLGFAAIAANDHLAFSRPWLDGPTLLSAVADRAGPMDLATTVALPALRGPAPLAAALATLSVLAPGRVIAGVGPGSSRTDYALAQVPFDERWSRFDVAASALRSLLEDEQPPASWAAPVPPGQVAATSVGSAPIPLWIASWGSPAGLRRVVRLGEGWLASAFHASVADFTVARQRLDDATDRAGRPRLPCAVATMWTYVTDDDAEAERLVRELLAPALGREPEHLRPRICVGSPGRCVDLLNQYRDAGCDRAYLWPIADEVEQLHRIATEVVPHVTGENPPITRR